MSEDRGKMSDTVQAQIENARRSKKLILSTALDEVPDEIFELSQLETLAFVNSKIRIVPERVRELPNLKRLDLRGSPIESVPTTTFALLIPLADPGPKTIKVSGVDSAAVYSVDAGVPW